MPAAKIAITIEETDLRVVDRWVSEGKYPSRSRAIQEALKDKIKNPRRKRLLEALSKLNVKEERAMSEEARFAVHETWDEY